MTTPPTEPGLLPAQRPDPGGIEGFVDAFDGTQVVGWAHDRHHPGRRLRIEIAAGDSRASVVADQERRDVAATGRNDGFCGFSATLHRDVAGDDPIHVREASTGIALAGSPIDPARLTAPLPEPASSVEGFIDFIDGNRVVGWAYDRALPGRRIQIAIAVGDSVTTILCDRFRQDVAASGLNDGFCGFAFDFDIRAAGRRLIHVRETSTGMDLAGSPFRADILNRLASPDNRAVMTLLHAEAKRALSSVSFCGA